MAGPLKGVKVVEMAGIGPGPFAAMMLSDMGAEVVRIQAKQGRTPIALMNTRYDVMARGRRSMAVDLKTPAGRDIALEMIGKADAVLEGFRPGVMERLGLGPDICLERQPRLVFGRMTGWGQSGPLAPRAGHDINYIALSGVLHAIGPAGGAPAIPLNLVGDFAGGLSFAFGIVCAILEARGSGEGQVVDAAMVDSSAALAAMMFGFKAAGAWSNQRGANLLDGAAPFYDTYECADGRYVAAGAIEPQFYRRMLALLGIDDPAFDKQMDQAAWPDLKRRLAAAFKTRTRDEWASVFEGEDACVSPVLDWDEAIAHPHNVARESFIAIDGVVQPAPTPRFGRTSPDVPKPVSPAGGDTHAILRDWGIDADWIKGLVEAEAI